jgi:hypothetical protein
VLLLNKLVTVLFSADTFELKFALAAFAKVLKERCPAGVLRTAAVPANAAAPAKYKAAPPSRTQASSPQ